MIEFKLSGDFEIKNKIETVNPHFNFNLVGNGVLVYRNSFFTLNFSFDDLKKSLSIPFFLGILRIGLVDKNLIALNTQKGALLYNEEGIGQLRRYLPTESVSNTFKDAEGNIWFTTLGNGIFRLNSEGIKTTELEEDYGRKSPVTVLASFNDTIYAGTSLNSIYRFKIGREDFLVRSFSNRVDRELSKYYKH